MKSKIIANSKYKNVGVLFELLVRQVTADTLAGLSESPALNIMKKHFHASTELGKELQLYRAFFDSGVRLTEAKAIHFIDLVVAQRKRLDDRKLAREKYELVKEIKTKYSLKEFLSNKIPDYVVHASIYKTFLSETAKGTSHAIMNIRDVATARFTLVEHLSGKARKPAAALHENAILHEFRKQDEEMRLLTFKYLIDKFNEKYYNLNERQTVLLREYINNVSNSFTKYVKAEIPSLKATLAKHAKKSSDKVIAIKLNEVASQLTRIEGIREVRDNEVAALMIAYEIVKEMES